jgi:hypothetical protein
VVFAHLRRRNVFVQKNKLNLGAIAVTTLRTEVLGTKLHTGGNQVEFRCGDAGNTWQ